MNGYELCIEIRKHFEVIVMLAVVVLAQIALSTPLLAAAPMSGIDAEISASSEWFDQVFSAIPPSPKLDNQLVIIREDLAGETKLNRADCGGAIRLGDKTYQRGIGVNANSVLRVTLAKPAARFVADIGLDRNVDGTAASAAFHVNVGGNDVFATGVMKPNGEVRSIDVPLNGAQTFDLIVDDGGDGRAFDQGDWANAKVVLQDGSELWLDTLGKCVVHTGIPFSFSLDSHPSSEFLSEWTRSVENENIDRNRYKRVITYTDPKTGLLVRCVAIAYRDYPTVEWTVYLKNTGKSDTPVISDIQALDLNIQRNMEGEFKLHYSMGSGFDLEDNRPLETALASGTDKVIAASNGRPTEAYMPYFNIEWAGGGMIAALGWPGQWASHFTRDAGTGLHIRGGQEFTHFKLHPGEEVRTPLVVLQWYKGSYIRSQNIWRRWMVAHNVPRPGGKLPTAHWSGRSSPQYGEMERATEENQKMFIDRYKEEHMKIDNWWMDAGWYINYGSWLNTGTWEVDPKRFPNGLKAISDHAHSNGIKTIVWFEPECVTKGTELYEKHPDWLLGNGNWRLLNLANPEARRWLTDHIDQMITDQGIDIYRQDFRMAPVNDWRANETEDRQGITEIRYIEGYLANLDELRQRHPNMLIDMCAAGGRRNELEEMRRAVPLWRSDCVHEPLSQQCISYGMAYWIPFSGTVTGALDEYRFRSNMCSYIVSEWDMRDKKLNYDLLRKLTSQWREVADYYSADFYPLTPYRLDKDVWIAWQYDRPETGSGIIQVFKRDECPYVSGQIKLQGLDADAKYSVRNLDSNGSSTLTGRELMENGLMINLPKCPSAGLFTYKKLK